MKPIIPFEPISTNNIPIGDKWVTQIKWDGVRMLYYFDGNQARLFNRKMNERTLQYPELLDTKTFCNAQSVILDGEIIAFDANKPSFHEIMKRDSLKLVQKIKSAVYQVPISYMLFDLLFYNGQWITDKSLEYRQQLLESIINPTNTIQIVQNFNDGKALFELIKNRQMEGVIYKDLRSTYSINGKDGRWRKHKVLNDLYAVVGGVTVKNSIVNSLLLGLYLNGTQDLIYIGHAGTGKITQNDWKLLTKQVNNILIDHKPFINKPERTKDAVWVRPEITVKVEYLEFTPGGTMRHPSIQAILDISKIECTTDQLSLRK